MLVTRMVMGNGSSGQQLNSDSNSGLQQLQRTVAVTVKGGQ